MILFFDYFFGFFVFFGFLASLLTAAGWQPAQLAQVHTKENHV